MVDLTDRPRLGPFVLTRELPPSALAERSLALNEKDQSSHMLHCFAACRGRESQKRFIAAIEAIKKLEHPHLLAVEEYAFDIADRPWVVTPYPGDASGVVTLGRLLREKGGRMGGDEAERAVVQLLEAVEHAHKCGVRHGPLGLEDVLVDRRGSVVVEFYGLDRMLRGLSRGDAEMERDEVRGVVEIGYQLITGLRAEAPLIPAGRLVKKLDPLWERWLQVGLDPSGGFDSAAEAAAELPSRRRAAEARGSRVTVRGVLGRLRPAGR